MKEKLQMENDNHRWSGRIVDVGGEFLVKEAHCYISTIFAFAQLINHDGGQRDDQFPSFAPQVIFHLSEIVLTKCVFLMFV